MLQYVKKRTIVEQLGRENIIMHFLLKDKRSLVEMLVDRLSAADLAVLHKELTQHQPIRKETG